MSTFFIRFLCAADYGVKTQLNLQSGEINPFFFACTDVFTNKEKKHEDSTYLSLKTGTLGGNVYKIQQCMTLSSQDKYLHHAR